MIVLLRTSLAFAAGLISKQTAENDALEAVGGGTVQQATLDSMGGKRIWSVDIAGSTNEYEVGVDAHTRSILKIIAQPSSPMARISKAQAEQDARAAVGGGEVLQAVLDTSGKNDSRMWSVDIAPAGVRGGKVISAVLEKNDNPVDWSVDIQHSDGQDYEVKVDACGGKVLQIVVGG